MRHLNIFAKVFMLVSAALAAVIIISYLLIYFLLPDFYRRHEARRYEQLVGTVVEELRGADEPAARAALLTGFAQQYGVDLILYDGEGETLFDYFQEYSVTIDMEIDNLDSNLGAGISLGATGGETAKLSVAQSYEADGEARRLELFISLEQLGEAKAVIIEIYPIAFACCIAIALLAAVLISNLFTKPIKALNHSVKKMAEMDPQAYAAAKSMDEIGELSRNVNQLYQELRGTIESLGLELARNQDAENQKIDFLRTISHELKNPLAAANALIEGMLYEIPPYDSDQKKHLAQCRELLEKAGGLARETLQYSKLTYREEAVCVALKELVRAAAADYMILISAKHIGYEEELPETLALCTNARLFSGVLSNLFSNAVNYTPANGRIRVHVREECADGEEQHVLVIENTCIPVSQEVLGQLFEKPYTVQSSPASTGLGLYIVNQLLNILHMRYRFAPSEQADGMAFEIFL